MAYVRVHRDTSGTPVASVFDRVTTEGDAARFNSAEVGYSEVFAWNSSAPTLEDGIRYNDYTLTFDYIVGAKQLNVFVGSGASVSYQRAVRKSDKDLIQAAKPAAGNVVQFYFEELGSSRVRVFCRTNPDFILVEVPHTSLPAANKEKVIVKDQGDNEAVELRGLGDGVVMHSPNGAKWLVRIDNSGTIVVEPRG